MNLLNYLSIKQHSRTSRKCNRCTKTDINKLIVDCVKECHYEKHRNRLSSRYKYMCKKNK